MRNLDLNTMDVKSYATEANLDKAIATLIEDELCRLYTKVRLANGRWTCLFMINHNVGGYVGVFAQAGFASC